MFFGGVDRRPIWTERDLFMIELKKTDFRLSSIKSNPEGGYLLEGSFGPLVFARDGLVHLCDLVTVLVPGSVCKSRVLDSYVTVEQLGIVPAKKNSRLIDIQTDFRIISVILRPGKGVCLQGCFGPGLSVRECCEHLCHIVQVLIPGSICETRMSNTDILINQQETPEHLLENVVSAFVFNAIDDQDDPQT